MSKGMRFAELEWDRGPSGVAYGPTAAKSTVIASYMTICAMRVRLVLRTVLRVWPT